MALLRKVTCNLRHPMGLRNPVVGYDKALDSAKIFWPCLCTPLERGAAILRPLSDPFWQGLQQDKGRRIITVHMCSSTRGERDDIKTCLVVVHCIGSDTDIRCVRCSTVHCVAAEYGSCAAMCSSVFDTDTMRDAMHFSVVHGVRTRELNGNLIY